MMPKVLKAASIRQNRDEYRAHSAHLDACRTQTKTGIIITFTLTERDEQLPSYKYVRPRSQYVMRDRCPDKNKPLDEHGQVAECSPLQQQTRLWPAKKNPVEQTNVQQHQVCWKNGTSLAPQQSTNGYRVDNLYIIHSGSLCFATHVIDLRLPFPKYRLAINVRCYYSLRDPNNNTFANVQFPCKIRSFCCFILIRSWRSSMVRVGPPADWQKKRT